MRANNPRFHTQRFSTRPSDLLPWADPYISALVTKLQNEVRDERSQARSEMSATGVLHADLDPPGPGVETDREWHEEPRWTTPGEVWHDEI